MWVSLSVYFVNVLINIRLIAVQVPRTRQLLHTFRSCTIFRSKVAVDMIIIRNVVLIYTNQHDYHLQHFEKPENDHVQLFIPNNSQQLPEEIGSQRKSVDCTVLLTCIYDFMTEWGEVERTMILQQ